jgi:hypothetical protein
MISPVSHSRGILIATKDSYGLIEVNIFRLSKDEKTDEYNINDKLCIFGLTTNRSALAFINDFPQMSAIDLLNLMNPEPILSVN